MVLYGLANRRLQPLGHLSGASIFNFNGLAMPVTRTNANTANRLPPSTSQNPNARG
jgi:hypothetical protein